MIEHIVVNGGGANGILNYGALKYLESKGFWDINNIKSIFGTSIGTILGFILCLKLEWNVIDDYLIKRKWEQYITLDLDHIININENKSIMNANIVDIFMESLLKSVDLDNNVTLLEFYNFSQIEFHLITCDLSNYKSVDLNYKSFPDLKLVDAIKMSTALPLIFSPVIYNNNLYIDGGLLDNYPLKKCLEYNNCKKDSILGLCNYSNDENIDPHNLDLLSFVGFLTTRLVDNMQNINNNETIKIPYEVKFTISDGFNMSEWYETFTIRENREQFIKKGEDFGRLFFEYIQLDTFNKED